ncbi:hypothetical protein FGB62_18g13 [Gracilaria domingensis]|nr:hypothetical protein FGB62_18g13 [Gracilaria domingensis]
MPAELRARERGAAWHDALAARRLRLEAVARGCGTGRRQRRGGAADLPRGARPSEQLAAAREALRFKRTRAAQRLVTQGAQSGRAVGDYWQQQGHAIRAACLRAERRTTFHCLLQSGVNSGADFWTAAGALPRPFRRLPRCKKRAPWPIAARPVPNASPTPKRSSRTDTTTPLVDRSRQLQPLRRVVRAARPARQVAAPLAACSTVLAVRRAPSAPPMPAFVFSAYKL